LRPRNSEEAAAEREPSRRHRPTGRPQTQEEISIASPELLSRQGRSGPRPRLMESHGLAKDEWWFTDLARHLQLPNPTLYSWVRRGWVHARQLPVAGGRWIIWADADELDRLRRLHRCPRSWMNRPQAAELTRPKPRPATSQHL